MTPYTMYEINYVTYAATVDKESEYFCFTVTPITVMRECVVPGCTSPSITAKDADGRHFQGSKSNYFATKEEAWEEVRQQCIETIANNQRAIKKLLKENAKFEEYLKNIAKTDPVLVP